ncbi:MAG: hypothetical protein RLZZ350_1421, partial [Verrucomicrobiota bacterium]
TDNDYNGVGAINFNRGHLCPSEDRTDTEANNDEVFFMSNIMPQSAPNNQAPWGNFEQYCRDLAASGGEILIVCGASGFGTNTIPSGKAYIGSNTWKIAVVVPLGSGTALSRITTTTNRVIAIKIPNVTNGILNSWTNYITTAHQIEQDTGFTFFTALPGTIASAFRARIDGLTNPPVPSITSFTPTSGATNLPVTITGTNFNSASAVKFNGVSAVFTVSANNQIVANVPTNATTGTIAVTTPGGTGTSVTSFTVSGSGGGSAPDLAVSVTHLGNFKQGDLADNYSVIVSNIGNAASTGTVTLVDSLPSGLAATAISGAGWTTTLGTLTATRADALAVGAAYPTVTITVAIATNVSAFVTNLVTVSGGGDTNSLNNTNTDIATVQIVSTTFTGTLIGWDMSTVSNYGVSPFAPTTNAPNLTVVGLTRGSGVVSNSSAAARGWGGVNWTSTSAASAIAANQFFTFSLAATAGHQLSFSNLANLDYRRSTTGATNGLLQYQIGSGAFVDLTNLAFTVSASGGASLGPIDLSDITALQNLGAGTNVTFRLVGSGGSGSSGTLYLFDVGNSSALDLNVVGSVSVVSGRGVLTGAPTTNGVALIFSNGISGTVYYFQTSTNLTSWVNLVTNTAPANGVIQFTDPQATNLNTRMYRVVK